MKWILISLCIVLGAMGAYALLDGIKGVAKSEEEGRKMLEEVVNYINNDVKRKQFADGAKTYLHCTIKEIRGIDGDFLLFDVIVVEKRFEDDSIVETRVENEENFGYTILYLKREKKWGVK